MIDRRDFMTTLAALSMAGTLPAFAQEGGDQNLGPVQKFSFDWLIEQAQARSTRPYESPYRPAPDVVSKIDYEAHGKLRFKAERALFADEPHGYPVTLFHLGYYFPKKVEIHVLSNGEAREVLYSPDYFSMPEDSVAKGLPADAGFAGFRLHEARSRKDWKTQDWVAFLGASYFRAIGDLNQYGLSARGVAVDVAATNAEEFPDFVSFWIDGATDESAPIGVYALLDGPSITGAFHFSITRTDGVIMDIDARLFARRPIERLGLMPLTSMFWYAEYNRGQMIDWRPEVHDSDGLAIWSGTGERIWRPLNNPRRVIASSFAEENPEGFGLLQRDRNVENYLDGVNYDRRPALWVEPLKPLGKGSIQLIEIPTDDEIHDNIVAFWVPAEPVKAGDTYELNYRLHWQADEPFPARLAHVVATRIGRGGEPGKPRPAGLRKFVVDFEGGSLRSLSAEAAPEADAWASRGRVLDAFVEPIPRTQRWRAQFDLEAEGEEPVEMRLFLRQGERALSETWAFQFNPTPAPVPG